MTQASATRRGVFCGFDVRIDPWAVDYGSETPTEFQLDADGPPRSMKDLLDEFDSDEADIAAGRACLDPRGGARDGNGGTEP